MSVIFYLLGCALIAAIGLAILFIFAARVEDEFDEQDIYHEN